MTDPDPSHAIEVSDSTGVQVGDHNVQQIIENYIAQQIVQPAAKRAECIVAGEIPQRAPAFQPRPDLIATLENSGPGVAVVRAVTGMRGVGKTQIAAAYAQDRINARWQLVAWINAADQAQVLRGLADSAAALGLGQPGQDLVDLGHAVKRWLEADGERCLVVFDNATDLDMLTEFVPTAGQCQVVITSNQESTTGLGTSVPVEVFTEAEAINFLARRSRQSSKDGAAELAAELGCLPLALAQAAAVIAAQRLPYAVYLDRLKSMAVQDYLRQAAGEPYPHGAAEAITLALDSAAEADLTGLCQPLMDLLGLLAETGVSRTLLHVAGQLGTLNLPDRTPAEPAAVDEALGHLASRSLLTFSIDGTTVTVHRLTMRVTRERTARNRKLAATATTAVDLLTTVRENLGEPWQNRSATRDIVGQIIALQEHVAGQHRQDLTLVTDMLRLRGWAVRYLIELGDSSPLAITYGTQLLTDREQALGDTHPDTLGSRNNLAAAYRAAGLLGEAIPLIARALTDYEQALGDTHPDTLAARGNLAVTYRDAGRLGEAIPLLERTWRTSDGSSATPTPTPWHPAATSPPPTTTPGDSARPSRYSNAPSPTTSRPSATPTPTPWTPAATSP